MTTGRSTSERRRRRWWPLLVCAVLVAVLVSPYVGRAAPTGRYRPPLATEALADGCYPLPAGLTIDFPYQLRSDRDVRRGTSRHRRLVLQYDRIDPAAARARITAALERAGLPARAATVTAYPRIPADAVVRGRIVLRLPVDPLTAEVQQRGACLDPFATKRFPRSWPPSNSYA